jgi:hypothetical protein
MAVQQGGVATPLIEQPEAMALVAVGTAHNHDAPRVLPIVVAHRSPSALVQSDFVAI